MRAAAEARRQGRRLVFTNGCFDLLHAGHVRYLQAARALGDLLVVGLNSDASVRRLKGPLRPFVPEAERAEVLAALAAVDYVVLFEEASPAGLIAALRPEVYAKGGDYAERPLPERPVVEAHGGRVVLLPLVEGRSSSALAERVAARLGGERFRSRFLVAWRAQSGRLERALEGSGPPAGAEPAARGAGAGAVEAASALARLLAEEAEVLRLLGGAGGEEGAAGGAEAPAEAGAVALRRRLESRERDLEAALLRLPAGKLGGDGAAGEGDLAARLEALLLERERAVALLAAAGGAAGGGRA
ncbi:MAG: D-glycero-beta-D-manno-heptose 1-phosphate adenylyltransferase [Bacillota bacterium]|nr:D-glycero-beta-D-manno-heptose 1-phosphate adenylyltransferase [Bacillota bacterium]